MAETHDEMVARFQRQHAIDKVAVKLGLAGCTQPEGSLVVRNTDTSIELVQLFSHDGCDVYRFFDGGQRAYYSSCTQRVENKAPAACSPTHAPAKAAQALFKGGV